MVLLDLEAFCALCFILDLDFRIWWGCEFGIWGL